MCYLRIIVTMLAMAGFAFFGCSKQNAGASRQPNFSDLSKDDAARLDRQRAVVLKAVNQRYGITSLTKTKADLPTLQHVLDDKVFGKNQIYELQCVGVAFGDVLASELPLHWTMVTDEYGTDPTLRFKESTIQVNALTMISKRVEQGERVNVNQLLQQTATAVNQINNEYQKH